MYRWATGGPSNNRQGSPGQLVRLGFRLNPRFPLIIPFKSVAPITKKRVILEKTADFARMLHFLEGGGAILNSEGVDCPPILNSVGAAAGAILNSECLGTHSLTHPLPHTHTPKCTSLDRYPRSWCGGIRHNIGDLSIFLHI